MNDNIKSFFRGFIPTVFILGIFIIGVVYFSLYKPRQIIAEEFVTMILEDEESIVKDCLKYNSFDGLVTLNQIKQRDQMCSCVATKSYESLTNLLKNQEIFNRLKENQHKLSEIKPYLRQQIIETSSIFCNAELLSDFQQKYPIITIQNEQSTDCKRAELINTMMKRIDIEKDEHEYIDAAACTIANLYKLEEEAVEEIFSMPVSQQNAFLIFELGRCSADIKAYGTKYADEILYTAEKAIQFAKTTSKKCKK